MCKVCRVIKEGVASVCNENLRQWPAPKISPNQFTEDFHLTKDLPLDSIGIFDVIQIIEDKLTVDFPDDFSPETVGDLITSTKNAILGRL